MDKREDIEKVRLDTEYLKELESYIEALHKRVTRTAMNEEDFAFFKEAEATNLTRLQKMKNESGYRKDKHKKRTLNDGWE
jgi:ribonuclease D